MEGTDVFMVEEGEWEEKEDGEEEARGKEQKTDGGEPEAKEDEDATAQPDEMEQNQECPSSQHTPGSSPLHKAPSPIHTDTSHHTPCHSNHNVQSSPDFDAEWHSYSHVWDLVDTIVFLGGWMENERKGGKQNEFELMTQHIGLVIVNSLSPLVHPKRDEDKNYQACHSESHSHRRQRPIRADRRLLPSSASTGLDETKRAPNAFEMSVVGFDEFSIEPLFVTAGEKSMLLNSHLKTTRMSVGEEVEEGRKRRRGRINLSNSSSISCERGLKRVRSEKKPIHSHRNQRIKSKGQGGRL
ncbi:hypothetical protein BLNAU_13747 [Blattamonas nauphoetae]|uniref:Uncharacterized protein n=1 Tax=Blattamonas nauphoetae TaxID=2049346 RepID=A0ABQ9XII5_9EUKA|nr:hypothetical protein BLNAU_13747 [Blattamonas nauphoetae]